MPQRWKLFLVIGFMSLMLDQGTKLWARVSLPVTPAGCTIPDDIVVGRCRGEAVAVIDGFWDWRLGFNPGSAFGMFGSQAGARVFLSLIGIGAVLLMLWMVHKAQDQDRRLAIALGLIVGGALGYLRGRFKVRLGKIYAATVAVTYVITFVFGLLAYPTFRYHVRGLYLDRYEPWASNLFDIKENFAALGLPIVIATFVMSRAMSPKDDRVLVGPYVAFVLLATSIVWFDVISGLVITMTKGP